MDAYITQSSWYQNIAARHRGTIRRTKTSKNSQLHHANTNYHQSMLEYHTYSKNNSKNRKNYTPKHNPTAETKQSSLHNTSANRTDHHHYHSDTVTKNKKTEKHHNIPHKSNIPARHPLSNYPFLLFY
jgi:hypothetical protein